MRLVWIFIFLCYVLCKNEAVTTDIINESSTSSLLTQSFIDTSTETEKTDTSTENILSTSSTEKSKTVINNINKNIIKSSKLLNKSLEDTSTEVPDDTTVENNLNTSSTEKSDSVIQSSATDLFLTKSLNYVVYTSTESTYNGLQKNSNIRINSLNASPTEKTKKKLIINNISNIGLSSSTNLPLIKTLEDVIDTSTNINVDTTNLLEAISTGLPSSDPQSTTITSSETSFGTTTNLPPTSGSYICTAPDAPKLNYSDFRITWNVSQINNNCVPSILRFNCTSDAINETIINVTLSYTKYLDINNELQKGVQYSCTIFIIMEDKIESGLTTITVPPGNLVINVTQVGSQLQWTAPFDNETLIYNITIQQLTPNHFVPIDCEDNEGKIQEYTTSNTFLELTDVLLADYNYYVVISTDFWNIFPTSNELVFTTPTKASGKPKNVFVNESLTVENKRKYTLVWKMPCDSNGDIKDFQIQITNIESKNIEKEIVFTNSSINNTDFSLILNKLAANSSYNLEIHADGANNQVGEYFYLNFTTQDDSLNVFIMNQGSTYFEINWTLSHLSENIPIQYYVDIYPLESNYQRGVNCSTPFSYNTLTDSSSYNFTEAWPFYKYNATVTASLNFTTNITGYVNVITDASIPEAPTNLNLTINDLLSKLTWELPCDVNGIFSKFKIDISEQYTEDSQYILNSTDSTKLNLELHLKPSHIYNINISILLQDGTQGKVSTLNYTTDVGIPGIPSINASGVTSNFFKIKWTPPEEKTGPIQFYELQITAGSPLYNVSLGCLMQNDSSVLIENKTVLSANYSNALPYNKYEIKIRANSSKGYGNVSITTLNTGIGLPDNVRNVNYTINNPSNEVYNASVFISYDPPCYMYGNFKDSSLQYFGRREGYETHNGTIINYNITHPGFKFYLKPEYNYTYYISISNEEFVNNSTHFLHSPAGVPSFNTSISIPIESVSTEKTKITLKKSYFSSINGDVRYIALILSETKTFTNESLEQWNSINWPILTEGVQLTDCFWNPFNISDEVVFTIGSGSQCSSTCDCNVPLKPDTAYYLTIRVFNDNFFRNSAPIHFRTDRLSRLGLILGIIFGILLCAVVGLIGFLVWKKDLYRKFLNIYPRKSSVKPLAPNTKAIPPKKFIQYFKNTQNKPELLKEQFIELAEKSKEIQAQNTTHFAALPENKRKNRYVNISPYDDTRVKLLIDEDDEIGSDYINASYVKGYTGGIEYIATQGPLPSTCRDFWKMVIQENVTIIVMVSQFIEKNKEKCYKYFPKNHENLIVSDDMEIRCSTELHFGTYLVRNLQIRKDSLQVSVTHMQFLEWPDFNVPSGTEHMLQFIYQLRERVRIEGGIVIVHCSAGVGRTGTLIGADMLLQNVNAGKQIDVYNTVLDLRKQRVMMVQTAEQYVYLHRLVADHIDRPPTPDQMEATDPVYENMDMLQNHHGNQNISKRKEDESQF